MADFRPLIYNPTQGVPEVLGAADTLLLGGAGGGIRHIGGALGFFNAPGVLEAPEINGDLFGALDQLIKALGASGMVRDARPAGWGTLGTLINGLTAVGPYVTGRLIVGSRGGWTALDLPAERPGVVQVPARVGGVLAYVPVSALTIAAPVRPVVGSIWADVSNGIDRLRLRIFDGNGWVDALPQDVLQLRNQLGQPAPGAFLIGDGAAWKQLAPGLPGQSLRITPTGPAWADLVRIGATPPWSSGQNRPAGDGTIWLDSTPGGEAVAFWDAKTSTWHRAIADSPVLEQLADLRAEFQTGDLITFENGILERLPLGAPGSNLRSRGGALAWEPTLRVSPTRGGVPPVAAAQGDLWLDGSALHVHDGNIWREVGADLWRAPNGDAQTIAPGTPVVLDSGGWEIGDATAPHAQSVGYGIAIEAADAGKLIACAWGGIATLSEAQWSDALDAPSRALVIAGLPAYRELWLSSAERGKLSVNPASGILVGRALSSSSLLLSGDTQSWARFASSAPAQNGLWWQQVLSNDLATRLVAGDLLAWDGSKFDVAATLGGPKITVRLKGDPRLADPVSGAPRPNGSTGAVARPPTGNGLLSGPSQLVDGELSIGTNPQDPALFWRLDDGSTTRLSRGDLARRYALSATDVSTDNTAAQLDLVDSIGIRTSVVLRGADGLEVTRTNAGTLVISGANLQAQMHAIDGGRFSPYVAPTGSAGTGTGTGATGTGIGPGGIDAGDFTP